MKPRGNSIMSFSCKIELSGLIVSSSGVLEVDGEMRTAIDWLILGAQRDSFSNSENRSVRLEHTSGELLVRIDKAAAAEIAVAQRIS